MPVVINEFEVLDAPAAAARGNGDDAVASAAPALPQPEDLHRLLAEMAEQQLRRFSH